MGVERLIGLRSTKNHAIALTIPIGAETDDKDKMGRSRWPKNLMPFDRQGGSSPNAAFMGLLGSIPCENYQGMFFAEQGNSYPVTGKL